MIREECGVFGIYAPGQDVAELTHKGLVALQHRGQSAAGIAVSDGNNLEVVKGLGLVPEALDHGAALSRLPEDGIFASGHVRYPTQETMSYEDQLRAIQPILGKADGQTFVISQNGHTINAEELERHNGSVKSPVTDGELICQLIAGEASQTASLVKAVAKGCDHLNGAYSLVVMGQNELIGLRDPRGFRPLVLGELDKDGVVIASEIAALNIAGANYVREVEPGEMVHIDNQGNISSTEPLAEKAAPALCAFEHIYFSRPGNKMHRETAEQVRFRSGQELAREAPVEADIVIGVPNSGMSAAYGFAAASQIPLKNGLDKNDHIKRTFIAETQAEREELARMKFDPIREVVSGQRVAVIDDSIIRSTTTRIIVSMLREAGAREVHLRVSSPPYKWPCFYGMNTGNINELIAASKTIEEIREEVGADSLDFLSLKGLEKALGQAAGKVCMACMTGEYQTPVPQELITLDQTNSVTEQPS